MSGADTTPGHLLNSTLMNHLPELEQSKNAVGRRPLTEEERRLLLKKRIKELRKRKRREKRRSGSRFKRLLPAILLIFFFLLCLFSSLFTLSAGGGNDNYLTLDLPASNQEQIEGRIMAPGEVPEPAISAAAAYLMDPRTGDVLLAKNPDQPLPMASTTKIMTAVVAMENGSQNDPVTISDHASAVGESSAWLEKGETLSVEQLLYALLIQSANDAAVALAEHVGGSEEAFVEMMNAKAAELGAEHTHFSNPHGLDADGHYTSARDLANIAAYAMQNPLFRDIVATDSYEIPWPGHPSPRVLQNHNKLLKMYPYATGIKTGYTVGAGKCLVASAERDGRELISVILNGGETYWDQTVQLMDYGFDYFARVEFAYSGQPLATVEVGDFPRRQVNAVPLSDLVFTVRRDYLQDFESGTIYYREWLPYPVTAGQELGYMVVGEGGPEETREILASDEYRFKPNFLVRFFSFIAAVFGLWWKGVKWLIPGL
jgi:D-alanyl-D-alanine carboxypeptidase (penicillin-binding protein 5/6)